MTAAPVAPDHERLLKFDADIQSKREANEREIERRRQLLADEIQREAAASAQRREDRRLAEEHAAKRPDRWKALPTLVKALYVVAAERPHTAAMALLRIAKLLTGADYHIQTPPETFEAP
jgi:hypothetical protein